MFLNYPRNNCKSDTCAFKFCFRMEPLKNIEQFGCVFHIETDSVISNWINIFVVGYLRMNENLRTSFSEENFIALERRFLTTCFIKLESPCAFGMTSISGIKLSLSERYCSSLNTCKNNPFISISARWISFLPTRAVSSRYAIRRARYPSAPISNP